MHQVINVNSHSLPGPSKKIRAKYTGKIFPEIFGIFRWFPLFRQIPAIVLDRLWSLKPIVASNKRPVGHLWNSIRFARGKCSSIQVSLRNESWYTDRVQI
jgi:hypothetical protein